MFAAATSDYLFTSLRSFESATPHIAEIRRLASEAGRDVGLLTTTHVVCRRRNEWWWLERIEGLGWRA